MELTTDLTRIQEIIYECERQCGELSKIKHKGGNEEAIDIVIAKIKQFLLGKNYITVPYDLTSANNEELTKIILFLMLNTRFNEDSTMSSIKEYAHLINIMPKLSKFLLINIIIENNLIECYAKLAFTLPLQIIPELFETANDTFISAEGTKTLKNVNVIVKNLIDKVNVCDTNDNRVFDIVRSINNIIGQLLMNLVVHPSISMPNASEVDSSLHIGYTLLHLFKMLLQVNENSLACGKIIDALVLATTMVAKHVTVNIYCFWAEVEEDNMPLQYAIGTEAYKVIEKYAKVKPASKLISLLTCMAKKPKSLSEIISDATVQTIVSKINEADANQRRWFAALLSRDVFNHDMGKRCLEKWSALCTMDDVIQILTIAIPYDDDSKRIAINCCSHLSIPNISILIARFFWIYEPWKAYVVNSNVQQTLTLLLNNLDYSQHFETETETQSVKQIQLALLESPQEVIELLFKECLKNNIYVIWMEPVFKAIKHVISLNNVPLEVLRDIIDHHEGVGNDGAKHVLKLVQMLIRTECADFNNLYALVLKPLTFSFVTQNIDNNRLDFILQVVKELPVDQLNEAHKEELIKLQLENLEKQRIKYTDFLQHKICICISSIVILTKLCSSFEDMPGISGINLNKMNSFYLTWTNENSCPSFLNHVFPHFVTDNYGQMISKLIKIVSRCVPSEWLLITEDLAANLGTNKAVEALTDCMILICEVTNTQNVENVTAYSALKFYLQNYGICVQKMRQKDSSLQFDTVSVKNICRLLKMLPKDIKYEEGVRLVTMLSDDALKSLSKDKQFVCSLAQIEDTNLTQIIAKKMLN